jgi:hypothetical protein
MAKKIIIRCLVLLGIIAVLNIIYSYTMHSRDIAENSAQAIEVKDKQPETDIYYFAESSNFSTAANDSITNSISSITNLFFPSLRITAINQAGTHAGIYKQWLSQVDVSQKKPKAVIVTLNLRSFNTAWINSSLEPALQSSVMLLKPYPAIVNRFLLSLNAFDNKTVQQRDRAIRSDLQKKKLKFPFSFRYKTAWDWDKEMAQRITCSGPDSSKIILACHYIKTYAFNLTEENPRIKDFDDISEWCAKNNIKLYYNLLAENVEYADSLVGKELVFLMRQNCDFLVKRYNKNNCVVIDNLELVKGIDYADQDWTTEHYNYRGRMTIAKTLAHQLKAEFNNYYKSAY